jgi:hypothetical protein
MVRGVEGLGSRSLPRVGGLPKISAQVQRQQLQRVRD